MKQAENPSQRIKQLRITHGLLQKDLAKAMNLSQQNISNIENGTSKLYDDLIKRFAEYFQVSTDYILGLTQEPSPKTHTSQIIQETAPYQTQNNHLKTQNQIAQDYSKMDNVGKAVMTSISNCLIELRQEP